MSLGSDPDHLVEALGDVFCAPQPTEEQDTPELESTWLAPSYDPDDYYVDLETSGSCSKCFNDICVITLGRMTGTTFPVIINSRVNINALYDIGATRSCMNYDTFFNLGLDLDNKPAPHMRTASGTDMGAIGFAALTFAINDHIFIQQFIVYRSQMRPLILGQDFCVCHCTGCEWTPHGTKRFTVN